MSDKRWVVVNEPWRLSSHSDIWVIIQEGGMGDERKRAETHLFLSCLALVDDASLAPRLVTGEKYHSWPLPPAMAIDSRQRPQAEVRNVSARMFFSLAKPLEEVVEAVNEKQ